MYVRPAPLPRPASADPPAHSLWHAAGWMHVGCTLTISSPHPSPSLLFLSVHFICLYPLALDHPCAYTHSSTRPRAFPFDRPLPSDSHPSSQHPFGPDTGHRLRSGFLIDCCLASPRFETPATQATTGSRYCDPTFTLPTHTPHSAVWALRAGSQPVSCIPSPPALRAGFVFAPTNYTIPLDITLPIIH